MKYSKQKRRTPLPLSIFPSLLFSLSLPRSLSLSACIPFKTSASFRSVAVRRDRPPSSSASLLVKTVVIVAFILRGRDLLLLNGALFWCHLNLLAAQVTVALALDCRKGAQCVILHFHWSWKLLRLAARHKVISGLENSDLPFPGLIHAMSVNSWPNEELRETNPNSWWLWHFCLKYICSFMALSRVWLSIIVNVSVGDGCTLDFALTVPRVWAILPYQWKSCGWRPGRSIWFWSCNLIASRE